MQFQHFICETGCDQGAQNLLKKKPLFLYKTANFREKKSSNYNIFNVEKVKLFNLVYHLVLWFAVG